MLYFFKRSSNSSTVAKFKITFGQDAGTGLFQQLYEELYEEKRLNDIPIEVVFENGK